MHMDTIESLPKFMHPAIINMVRSWDMANDGSEDNDIPTINNIFWENTTGDIDIFARFPGVGTKHHIGYITWNLHQNKD